VTALPAEARRSARWLAWIAATSVGYALGLTANTLVAASLRPLAPILAGLLVVMVYGSVTGAVLGGVQFLVLGRGLVRLSSWMLATIAGAAVGFVIASVVGEAVGNWFGAENAVLSQGITTMLGGALIGLGVGLGQWFVLRRAVSAGPWLLATAIGGAAGGLVAAAVVGLFEVPVIASVPSASVGALLGLVIGLGQGNVLGTLRGTDDDDGVSSSIGIR
jgi:hypothetical protein